MDAQLRRLSSSALLLLMLALWPAIAAADTRTDARRYFNRGMEAIQEGRTREGIDLLIQAYEIKPHPHVLFNVARAYASVNEVDLAIEYFEKYLASGPADAGPTNEALLDLRARQRLRRLVDEGMNAIAAGRYLEGVSVLQRAYVERPHPNLVFNIAKAYENAGELRLAVDSYKTYLASGPPDSGAVEARISALEERLDKNNGGRPSPRPSGAPVPAGPADDEEIKRIAQRLAGILREQGAIPSEPIRRAARPGDDERGTGSSTAAIGGGDVKLAAKDDTAYEEVVVTASRREQSPLDAPNAVTIITSEDIRLSGVQTIPDLLRRVPGMDVMTMTPSDANVAMRGFNRRLANKILVLVDGRSVYQDFLGATLWAGLGIDLLDIDRIEVVRGPGSAIYGAYAYTGIVNILTKSPEAIGGSTLRAYGGSGNTVGGLYQYGERKGPIAFRASVDYGQADKYEREFGDRVDYTGANSSPNNSYQAGQFDAELRYHLKDAGHFFAGGGGRLGTQDFNGVSVLRNQHLDGAVANARLGYEGRLFSLLAFWNGTRIKSSPEYFRTGLPSLGSNVNADSFSVEPIFRPTFSLLGEHSMVLGAEYRHKFIDWDYLDGTHAEDYFAVFAQDSWAFNKRFTVLARGRVDKHPLIGFLGSPRLALIFKPSSASALRASVGTAFRLPNQAETYLELAASSPIAGVAIELIGGQDKLVPERIFTVDVGFLQQLDFGEFEIVGYLNRLTNLINPAPLTSTSLARGFDEQTGAYVGAQSLYVNETDSYLALGGEASARIFPIDGLDIGLSYAFQFITNTDTGKRFTDSPLHKLTVWGQYRSKFGLDLGFSVHFVSDQDWVEPTFKPSDPSGFDTTPLPLPASVAIMARVGYRLFDDKLELAISGTNLADTGANRHLEHPFGTKLEARILGSVTARF